MATRPAFSVAKQHVNNLLSAKQSKISTLVERLLTIEFTMYSISYFDIRLQCATL